MIPGIFVRGAGHGFDSIHHARADEIARLQKDGYLRTYDKTFQGRNRRYYTVTEKGREQFQQFYDQWKRMRVKIDEVMDGGIAK